MAFQGFLGAGVDAYEPAVVELGDGVYVDAAYDAGRTDEG